MALVNFTNISIVPSSSTIPAGPYNSEVLEIFKDDGHPNNDSNIYISITEPPKVANGTTHIGDIPQWKKILSKIHSFTMAGALIVLTLGMGSHVYWKELIKNLWPPLPILIGMVGQFVLMPCLAFGISSIFKMDPYVALGCLILSCCPGGAFSNFFTYWVYGDVALSLVMTTCSTILSFGAMPLNIWLYSGNIVGDEAENIVIPYKNIVVTLCLVCGPVLFGMVLRHFNERIANKTTQITSLMGYVIVSVSFTMSFILYWEIIVSAHWKMHISVIILPFSAILFAYLVALISGRSHKVCRTIGIETASQNMPLAVGVILLSFSDMQIRAKILLYPLLFGIYLFIEIILGTLLFRLYYSYKEKSKTATKEEKTENSSKLENI